jgi:hypothetical protein
MLIAALWCLTALPSSPRAHASCKPVPLSTPTRWGGNETVVIDLSDHPSGSPRGEVVFETDPVEGAPVIEPVEGALVQVFKQSLAGRSDKHEVRKNDHAITACLTRSDGKFSFDLAPGEYQIRASLNSGVDVTSVLIVVQSGMRHSPDIHVRMKNGT